MRINDELKESNTIFYKEKNGVIPLNIINDFDENTNFLLLFVNPKSGSNEGQIIFEYVDKYKEASIKDYDIINFPVDDENEWFFTKSRPRSSSIQSFDEIKIKGVEHPTKFDPSIPFSIIVFNLIDQESYTKGKKFINNYINDYPILELKILIGGGDGSVLSLIEDLSKDNINLSKCIFGHIPLGTGNDLSNSLGFGPSCEIGFKIEYFQRVLYTYLTASSVKIDIWEITIKVDKNEGRINEVDTNGEVVLTDKNESFLNEYKKSFINYISIGFDAKVGFMFGQKRTRSRICNKIIYGWEAAKDIFKSLFQKNLRLASLLESFETVENEKTNKKIPIFVSKDLAKGKKKIEGERILKGNPVVIVAQNIDFYMGGVENIWKCSQQVGIQLRGLKRKEKKIFEQNINKSFIPQVSDDKILEFFTYEHGIEMGLDRVTNGRAKKVHQGFGPFFFTFKKNPSKSQKKKLNKVYINIDGEYFHLMQPVQISILRNENLCNGQLKFLKNEIAIWKLKQKSIFSKVKKIISRYKVYIISFVFSLLLIYAGFKSAFIFLVFMFLIFF